MGIFDENASGPTLDAANTPGGISQQNDVIAIALNGEVLIERAHYCAFRLSHHGIKRCIGNRTTAGDRRQPCPAPGSQFPVYAVAMQVCAVPTSAGGNAF